MNATRQLNAIVRFPGRLRRVLKIFVQRGQQRRVADMMGSTLQIQVCPISFGVSIWLMKTQDWRVLSGVVLLCPGLAANACCSLHTVRQVGSLIFLE